MFGGFDNTVIIANKMCLAPCLLGLYVDLTCIFILIHVYVSLYF
jgi:hypothetical protein